MLFGDISSCVIILPSSFSLTTNIMFFLLRCLFVQLLVIQVIEKLRKHKFCFICFISVCKSDICTKRQRDDSKFPIFGYKFATYMKYFVVDAFAQEPFGGNPAGVVLLGGNVPFPEGSLMVKIAAELRYSETAFVQQNGPAEFTVRYFTPAAEVDLCGHATIATFSVLRDEGIVPPGTVCCNHTLAGDLEVIVGEQIMMQMAPPQVVGVVEDIATLHKIMNSRIQIQSAAVQQTPSRNHFYRSSRYHLPGCKYQRS